MVYYYHILVNFFLIIAELINFYYYLALNLSTKCFSPSLLFALDDQIVPFTFLKMCLKLYLSDERCQPEIDPFISPILASDEVFLNKLFNHLLFIFIKLLSFFPPVRIMSGSLDPLHDDCWRFTEKLL